MNDPKRILVVVLGFILLSLGVFGIKGYMDGEGYKKQVNYVTAVQTTNKDHFNYAVDSQQGRVLTNGAFATDPKNLAKFDEMTQGFTYVARTLEHYTMHTRENCTTDSNGFEYCTTETYYTWDPIGSNEAYAQEISFMGRNYPATLFNYFRFKTKTNACAFTAPGTGGGLLEIKRGCLDGNFYLDDYNRYAYYTVPLSFNATFLATTYGGLNPFNESAITLQNKSIEQVLKDVGKYQLIGFWVVVGLLVLLLIIAGYAAYAWVMADGYWSLEK